jgi:hypothetical protein
MSNQQNIPIIRQQHIHDIDKTCRPGLPNSKASTGITIVDIDGLVLGVKHCHSMTIANTYTLSMLGEVSTCRCWRWVVFV